MRNTKIKQLLFERGIKQNEIKDLIDSTFPETPISLSTLNHFINGKKSNITIATIKRLCVVLDVTPNDIIDMDYDEVEDNEEINF